MRPSRARAPLTRKGKLLQARRIRTAWRPWQRTHRGRDLELWQSPLSKSTIRIVNRKELTGGNRDEPCGTREARAMLRNGSRPESRVDCRRRRAARSTRSYLNEGLELVPRRVTAPSPGRQVEPRRRARLCAGQPLARAAVKQLTERVQDAGTHHTQLRARRYLWRAGQHHGGAFAPF